MTFYITSPKAKKQSIFMEPNSTQTMHPKPNVAEILKEHENLDLNQYRKYIREFKVNSFGLFPRDTDFLKYPDGIETIC